LPFNDPDLCRVTDDRTARRDRKFGNGKPLMSFPPALSDPVGI